MTGNCTLKAFHGFVGVFFGVTVSAVFIGFLELDVRMVSLPTLFHPFFCSLRNVH